MIDKLYSNILFVVGIGLLLLAIGFPAYQVILGTLGSIVTLIWLGLLIRLKCKKIIAFFRGY